MKLLYVFLFFMVLSASTLAHQNVIYKSSFRAPPEWGVEDHPEDSNSNHNKEAHDSGKAASFPKGEHPEGPDAPEIPDVPEIPEDHGGF